MYLFYSEFLKLENEIVNTVMKRDASIEELESSIEQLKIVHAGFGKKSSAQLDELKAKLSESKNDVRSLNSRIEAYKDTLEVTDQVESSLRKQLEWTKKNFEQKVTESLDDFDLSQVVRSLINRMSSEEVIAEITTEEKELIAALYGIMHKSVPDQKWLSQLALVPDETLRARQIQTIVQHYTNLIHETENSEISPEEKKHVIRAYRMARERELADAGAET